MVQLVNGYVYGSFPPGIHGDFTRIVAPLKWMLRAHAAAYHAMKARKPHIRIGIAHHLRVFAPHWKVNPLEFFGARSISEAFNWALPMALETGSLKIGIPFSFEVDEEIQKLRGTQDFLGVNYYSRDLVEIPFPFQISKQRMRFKSGAPATDMGWEIYPEGLYTTLQELHQRFPTKPIFITENGIADRADSKRVQFIKDHLIELKRALDAGIPVEGYCYWSLMDNFEWAEGFEPKFGLYAMDPKTQARKRGVSVDFFAKLAKENRFSIQQSANQK